uniref:Uncharacterized protein n=1 Tax=Glossina pallidipes TaxID=7398 RepID=A0A1B0A9U8_GLOPL
MCMSFNFLKGQNEKYKGNDNGVDDYDELFLRFTASDELAAVLYFFKSNIMLGTDGIMTLFSNHNFFAHLMDGDALNRTSVKCVRDAMLFDSRQVASHWSGCWQRSNGRPTTTTTLCTQHTALYVKATTRTRPEKKQHTE